MDAAIRIQDAKQALHSKVRHRISAVNSERSQSNFPDVCCAFVDDIQLSNYSTDRDHITAVSGNQLPVVNRESLVSSQHFPLYDVVIDKRGVDNNVFSLREESVFRHIVQNGNVEFRPDVAVLVDAVSPEALSWFLPGDQLIAVNDVVIKSKDDGWRYISECSTPTLKLSVCPLVEMSQLSSKHVLCCGQERPRKVNFSQQHNVHVGIVYIILWQSVFYLLASSVYLNGHKVTN